MYLLFGKRYRLRSDVFTVSVREQLEKTREYIRKRYKAEKFIAYFQNYTNTFMPLTVFPNI